MGAGGAGADTGTVEAARTMMSAFDLSWADAAPDSLELRRILARRFALLAALACNRCGPQGSRSALPEGIGVPDLSASIRLACSASARCISARSASRRALRSSR